METLFPRVLSIQSHVVSGYAGNKCATFPLQVHGFEVDVINTVHFSNHTGYGYWKGQVLNENDFDDLIDGLSHNNLDYYTHLLTGYIRTPKLLEKIAKVVQDLKKKNPKLIYACDPVMGDNGKMYVPEDILPIYRDYIIPLSDIITPNQFETELLTEITIKNLNDAWKAIEVFHNKGIKTVVISSTEFHNKDNLLCIASSIKDGKKKRLTIEIPKIDQHFTGTGDLFSALFLAWMHKSGNDITVSINNSIATLQAVLKRSIELGKALDRPEKPLELKIIQSKKDIEHPNVEYWAKVIEEI